MSRFLLFFLGVFLLVDFAAEDFFCFFEVGAAGLAESLASAVDEEGEHAQAGDGPLGRDLF